MTNGLCDEEALDESLEDLSDECSEGGGGEQTPAEAIELKLKADRLESDQCLEDAIARTVLDPTLGNAVALIRYGSSQYQNLELSSLKKALEEQTQAIKDGDFSRAEEMLTAQAHTLDALFHKLSRLAFNNANEGYLKATDSFLKMALRAQSQCRSTWEAVSAIKNPPVVGYVKQANFGVNQQVNNDSRAEKTENPPTKLSGGSNELCENPGTPRIEKKADSTLETLGEVHRAEITRGED